MAGTWSYTRTGELLEVRMLERDEGVDLIVRSATETAVHPFGSHADLLAYHTSLEATLLAAGWAPRDFFPDRRTGRDRRLHRRAEPNRRRALTRRRTARGAGGQPS